MKIIATTTSLALLALSVVEARIGSDKYTLYFNNNCNKDVSVEVNTDSASADRSQSIAAGTCEVFQNGKNYKNDLFESFVEIGNCRQWRYEGEWKAQTDALFANA